MISSEHVIGRMLKIRTGHSDVFVFDSASLLDWTHHSSLDMTKGLKSSVTVPCQDLIEKAIVKS